MIAPRHKECVLHIAAAHLLRQRIADGWLFCHIPAGLAKDARHEAKLRAFGVQPGWPDLIVISPHGSVRCLEFKRIGETLSEVQEAFRLHCVRQGIPFCVARTMDEATTALTAWSALAEEAPRR